MCRIVRTVYGDLKDIKTMLAATIANQVADVAEAEEDQDEDDDEEVATPAIRLAPLPDQTPLPPLLPDVLKPRKKVRFSDN